MLAHEKAVLGFYVTRHPLTQHVTTLERFATCDCADLANAPDTLDVVVGGLISRVRFGVTKTGRNAGAKLAVLTFEDLTGAIEAVVFSEVLERYRELIGPDRPLFLRGRVDRRRETPSLHVSEVIALADVGKRLSSGLLVRLPAADASRDMLGKLLALCRAHRGDRPVFLEITARDGLVATIRCDDSQCVTPNDALLREAEAVVGEGRVVILGGSRQVARRQAVVAAPVAEPEEAEEPAAV
jgi:DNA polymerase-3 subunit alpha